MRGQEYFYIEYCRVAVSILSYPSLQHCRTLGRFNYLVFSVESLQIPGILTKFVMQAELALSLVLFLKSEPGEDLAVLWGQDHHRAGLCERGRAPGELSNTS